MPTRKNVNSLSTTEKQNFVQAVLDLKANGTYDQFVRSHANAPMLDIHQGPAFLPWHRQFLLDFEKALQNVSGNPNMFVPYWDWPKDAVLPDPKTAPIWSADMLGGDGDASGIVRNGAFQAGPAWIIVDDPSGPELRRRMGQSSISRTLPTQADIDQAMAKNFYDNSTWRTGATGFRNHIEGWITSRAQPELHNRGHVWVGGSMTPMTSPNDPAFFLHHCMVDLVWAQWQKGQPGTLEANYQPVSETTVPRHNLDDLMHATPSGSVTPRSVLDINALGYDYDVLPAPVGGGTPGGGTPGGGTPGGGTPGGGTPGGGTPGGGTPGGGTPGGGTPGGGTPGGGTPGGGTPGGGTPGGGTPGGGTPGGGTPGGGTPGGGTPGGGTPGGGTPGGGTPGGGTPGGGTPGGGTPGGGTPGGGTPGGGTPGGGRPGGRGCMLTLVMIFAAISLMLWSIAG